MTSHKEQPRDAVERLDTLAKEAEATASAIECQEPEIALWLREDIASRLHHWRDHLIAYSHYPSPSTQSEKS